MVLSSPGGRPPARFHPPTAAKSCGLHARNGADTVNKGDSDEEGLRIARSGLGKALGKCSCYERMYSSAGQTFGPVEDIGVSTLFRELCQRRVDLPPSSSPSRCIDSTD